MCASSLLVLIASPALARRSGSPLKNCSPAGSPKSGGSAGGRKQCRIRLPQLGSRHRLSTSKENLDSSSTLNITSGSAGSGTSGSNKESGPEPEVSSVTEVEALVPLGPGGSGGSAAGQEEGNTLDSWSEEASGSESDGVLMNGLNGAEDSHSNTNGHTETNADVETALHQRDDICLEPVYNLYAISVSVTHASLNSYAPLSTLLPSLFVEVVLIFCHVISVICLF